jgi:hypothetical protein
MSEELPTRTELLNTVRGWQRQDLKEANAWLAENRILFRQAVYYDQEGARREGGRRLIRAMSERN